MTPPAAICRRQSAMAWSRLNILFPSQTGQNRVNQGPLFVLFFHRPFAVLLERVVFALPPGFTLRPPRLDPTLVFHAVQDGVKHSVGPFQPAAGPGFDLLDDCVAVTLALLQQRENHRFGGGRDEFFAYHRSTIHSLSMY